MLLKGFGFPARKILAMGDIELYLLPSSPTCNLFLFSEGKRREYKWCKLLKLLNINFQLTENFYCPKT